MNVPIDSDLSFLQQLPQLLSLNLRFENQLVDINDFATIKELRYLSINGAATIKIKNPAPLEKLEYLALTNGKIEDIQVLKSALQLQTLCLSFNKIKDFSVLKNLKELSNLIISNNPIEQFPAWEHLPKLTSFIGGRVRNQKINLPAFPHFPSISNLFTDFELIAPLGQLPPKLSTISIILQPSTDLTPLKKCKKLSTISFETSTQIETLIISDFEAIERITFGRETTIGHLIIKDNPILKRINIRGANISEISVVNNPSLLNLSIERSQLTKINHLSNLPNLSGLKLSSNQLSSFPNSLDLPNLRKLNLSDNQLTNINFVAPFSNLRNLTIRSNRIKDIQSLQFLPFLKNLDLSNNNIEDITSLKHLRFLESLTLYENQITILKSLAQLTKLNQLRLDNNKIVSIKDLANLKKLKSLELGNNQIKDISSLSNLSNLSRINLENNQITDVYNLSKLGHLNNISLRDNQLTKYPISFLKMKGLRGLDVVNNPIVDIPYEISNNRNSLPDARNWFEDLAISNIENYDLKLIVVGNGRIGKTCIVNRLLFDTYRDNETSTHAIQLHRWQKEVVAEKEVSKTLHINVWDFGGQDIYHATHRLFMQSRALYLVVWDALMEQQLNSEEIHNGQKFTYRNFGLPYWVEYIRSHSKKSPTLIVQNKIDRDKILSPPNKEKLEEIYPIEKYLGVSAKEATNIQQLDQVIIDTIFAKMPEIGLKMPLSWYQVKQLLLAKAENIIAISFEAFETICLESNVQERSIKSLLTYLHNCGIVFYKEQLFEDKIILDQRWAIEAVYLLFNRTSPFYQSKKGVGIFNLDEFSNALPANKYSESEQKVILTFMESCQICFKNPQKPNHPEYIVPELLPDNPLPKVRQLFEIQDSNALHLIYQHPILHRSFLQRFIIKAGHLAKTSEIWRHGIYFKYQDSWASVKAKFEDYSGTIQLQTHGSRKEYLMYLIQGEFNRIYNYKDLELPQLVSADGVAFVRLDNLRKVNKEVGRTHITAIDGSNIEIYQLSYFTKSPADIKIDLAKTIQDLGYRLND